MPEDPLAGLPADLAARVALHPATGCWLLRGRGGRSVPVVCVAGRGLTARRWVFERLVGPLPAGRALAANPPRLSHSAP